MLCNQLELLYFTFFNMNVDKKENIYMIYGID